MMGKMKVRIYKYGKMVFSLVFLLFLSISMYAQENKDLIETAAENSRKDHAAGIQTETRQDLSEGSVPQKEETKQDLDKKKKKKENEEASSKVKEVKGSNPDMSKAKGARPPYIVRPSGSAMPKGAGKPGGAIKPGRR